MFRVCGHVAIGSLAACIEEVGPNRFWFAFLLVGIGSPIAIALNLVVREQARNWVEALFDLLMVVTLVHLVPHLWVVAMCLGLMVALAPSISFHPASHWIYLTFGSILLVGMGFAAWVHDVQGWQLPLLAVAVTYPSMLYYTYSQMKRANELRRYADRTQALTEVAGSLAHDFNNLLAVVIGHADLALKSLPDDSEARKDLSQVLVGATSASQLSGQLLSFSGRSSNRIGTPDLKSELSVIVGLLEPAMPAGVGIELELPSHSVSINGDVSQLQQVLMNVLMNAGEAMIGRSGTVVVKLFRTSDERRDGQHRANVMIADQGPGIPAGLLEKVFEPFFSTKNHGRGMGLAAVKRIMEELGGEITLTNARPGTEILMSWDEVPADDSLAPSTEFSREPSPAALASNQRILVVDDQALVRSVAVKNLQRMGVEVIEASDAFEAESIFQEQHARINAVLLDLKMPVKDGWACLKELRGICSSTPIVVCSGFDPAESIPRFAARDLHLKSITKPYSSQTLAEALFLSVPQTG